MPIRKVLVVDDSQRIWQTSKASSARQAVSFITATNGKGLLKAGAEKPKI
ncbi:MAG: hypothetical protein R3F40_03140 [Candidatus Competibacteraceae bacterium]